MNELRLSDIIARKVTVEWHEGVAVVRAVAERLLATDGPTRAIPELHQVVLFPTGQLDVNGGTAVDEPVRRMGQLLQATLATADPPVQLRLVVSQATAPTPGFASIEDFDAALGYYERPNRQAVLQDLYARAAAAPLPTETQPTPELDMIAPLPTAKSTRREPKKPRGKLRRGPLVAAAVLVALGAGSLYYLKTIGFTSNSAEVEALTQRASSAVGSAIVSGVSAVTERVGLGRLVSPDAAPSPAPSVPANVTDKKPAVIRTGKQTLVALDLDPKFMTGLPRTPAPSGVLPEEPAPPAAVEDDNGPIGDAQIYSPNSAGVTPPVTKRMHLARELPAGVVARDLGRVDLIIGP